MAPPPLYVLFLSPAARYREKDHSPPVQRRNRASAHCPLSEVPELPSRNTEDLRNSTLRCNVPPQNTVGATDVLRSQRTATVVAPSGRPPEIASMTSAEGRFPRLSPNGRARTRSCTVALTRLRTLTAIKLSRSPDLSPPLDHVHRARDAPGPCREPVRLTGQREPARGSRPWS
jgi:hypothetical protein